MTFQANNRDSVNAKANQSKFPKTAQPNKEVFKEKIAI